MRSPTLRTAALLALSTPLAVVAQSATQVQPNITICNWAGLRSALIRDTIYLDGGKLWWQSALDDNGLPVRIESGGAEGLMFSLNLSYAFDTTTYNETTSLLQPMSKTGGTAANNIAPNYVDGAMFANHGEFLLYGGLLRLTDAYSLPEADTVLSYEAYPSGPEKPAWAPGYVRVTLPDDVTRYVSNGAAVSVPSENLGFYFSGIRAADWGSITQATRDWYLADTLIEVDMSTMREEVWSNNTIPDDVEPRAGAELVWIPVGGQGVLVAIGGMTAVVDHLSARLNSSQLSDAEEEAPGFMTSLPVYEIVSKTWYMQNTTGDGPGQLTEFCSVVAPASDASSFNIYVYGGYPGVNSTTMPSDDVWILSIPAFVWVKAYSGVSGNGRRGHKCERVYPDQMLVIGGVNPNPDVCIEAGPIQVFNLNTLEFQNVYDPREWSEYVVPDPVTAVIGGNGQGGSTESTTFSDEALSSIFNTPYTKTIEKDYPYPAASGSPGASTSHTPVPNSGLADWVAPVLGVVLGLIVVSIVAVLFILYRRRRNRRNSSNGSQSGGSSHNNRIWNYINGIQPNHSDHKSDPSVTSTEAESDNCVSSPLVGASEVAGQQRYEVAATPVASTAPMAELEAPGNLQHSTSRDYAYLPQSASQTQTQGLGLSSPAAVSPQSPQSSQSTHPRSHPHGPEDVGSHFPISSPSPNSPAVRSPDLQNRAAAADAGGTDGLQRRPTHARNVSSQSSNLYQPSSPESMWSPDGEGQEGRRGAGIIGPFGARGFEALNPAKEDDAERPATSRDGNRPKDGANPGESTNGGLERKQTSPGKKSSFGEMLEEGDRAAK